MALGAQRVSVFGQILRRSLALTALGVVLGGLASFALTRYLGSLLFDVRPNDPTTLVLVAVLLATGFMRVSLHPALLPTAPRAVWRYTHHPLAFLAPRPHFMRTMSDVVDRLKSALADRYTIEREIGSGGMATVYLAEDVKHERKVAVKVLRPELAAALGSERFHQEIKIAAQLHHPHILQLYDSGEADGFLYYVMPYEEGQSLREKLAREGELPVPEAVRILHDVVDALTHAHKHNVVHRDIKPDNVMLSDRHALVTDFGVAKAVSEATGRQKLTTEGVALGTPAYMAPEQAAADPHIDHRADIYAVGAVAYELLTGRPPFTGTTQQELLAAHVTQSPDPVTKYRESVPPALEQLVMKCLEKKAADRWQSAEEMLPQLEALATPSGGMTPTAQVPVKRRSRWWIPAAAAALGATVVATYLVISPDPAPLQLQERLVAIFPFENRTDDLSLDQLGQLAADRLIEGLTQVSGVDVVPRSSVEQALRNEPEGTPLHQIAASLGAFYAFTGYYTKQGEDLIFRVEVIEAGTGEHFAALESPSGDLSNPGLLLDSLQQRLMTTVMLALGGVDFNALPRLPTIDVASALVRGGELFQARDWAGSAQQYIAAYRMDSAFISSLVPAMTSYANMGNWSGLDSLLAIVTPHRAEISRIRGYVIDRYSARVGGDLEGALQAERMSMDADSNSSTLFNLSVYALATGRPREALGALEQIDTESEHARTWPDHWWAKAIANHWLGRYETALEAARTGKSRFPERLLMRRYEMQALIALGRLDDIGSLLDEVARMEPNGDYTPAGVFIDVSRALARSGHLENSRALADRAVEWYRARDPEHYRKWIARALLLAGHADGALEIIKLLVEETPDSLECRGIYGIALAQTGDSARAEVEAAWFEDLTRPYLFGEDTHWRGVLLAHLGREDEAVLLLRQAYREGRSREEIRDDPNLMPLWGHEQFEQFVAPRG